MVQAITETDGPQCDHPVVEKTLGQIAYEIWEDSDGLNLPRREEYSDMTQNMRNRWETVASAVREKVRRETIEECAKTAAEGAANPKPFDLDDPAERDRLIRETAGYMRVSLHHGTDQLGRTYASESMADLWMGIQNGKFAVVKIVKIEMAPFVFDDAEITSG